MDCHGQTVCSTSQLICESCTEEAREWESDGDKHQGKRVKLEINVLCLNSMFERGKFRKTSPEPPCLQPFCVCVCERVCVCVREREGVLEHTAKAFVSLIASLGSLWWCWCW